MVATLTNLIHAKRFSLNPKYFLEERLKKIFINKSGLLYIWYVYIGETSIHTAWCSCDLARLKYFRLTGSDEMMARMNLEGKPG